MGLRMIDRYVRPGVYRRRVRIETDAGTAHAEMEDDPHRYGVTLRHDGSVITAIEGRALRTPWSACGEAAALLQRLVGMELHPDPQQVYRHTNGRLQCTHLFDLAGLGAAHAARGIAARTYDAEVPCIDPALPRAAVLRVDGEEALRWTLKRTRIVGPPSFAGQDVATMMAWAKQRFIDRDRLEAVLMLRRAVFVSGNRRHDLDGMARASDTGHTIGACHVFSAGVVERALRVPGATRDFTDPRARLLADLEP
jgi:hypothetical protein